jgi:hypothetical protein
MAIRSAKSAREKLAARITDDFPNSLYRGKWKVLWKLPQRWKSKMVACGVSFFMISTAAWKSLRKKQLRLFHSYHRPGGDQKKQREPAAGIHLRSPPA